MEKSRICLVRKSLPRQWGVSSLTTWKGSHLPAFCLLLALLKIMPKETTVRLTSLFFSLIPFRHSLPLTLLLLWAHSSVVSTFSIDSLTPFLYVRKLLFTLIACSSWSIHWYRSISPFLSLTNQWKYSEYLTTTVDTKQFECQPWTSSMAFEEIGALPLTGRWGGGIAASWDHFLVCQQ